MAAAAMIPEITVGASGESTHPVWARPTATASKRKSAKGTADPILLTLPVSPIDES
jgi:hypothetical protein